MDKCGGRRRGEYGSGDRGRDGGGCVVVVC